MSRNAALSSSPPQIANMEGYLHLPSRSRLGAAGATTGDLSENRAVFLDRDGVLVKDVHFLTSTGQLRLLPGAAEAIRLLQDQFFVIVVTNQSGIARGMLTEGDLLAIHEELLRRLYREGALLDALYYCPHLPDATVEEYRLECQCRKPKAGMLLRAAHDWHIDLSRSYMVGDMPRDIEAAVGAGVRPVMVGNGSVPSLQRGVARNLLEAALLILKGESEKCISKLADPEIQRA